MSEGKKGRKVGRNKLQCAAYRSAQRREFNKARRLIKYLRKWPRDTQAQAALKRWTAILYTAQRKALGLTTSA